MFDLKKATSKLLDGCIIETTDNIGIFTPDGKGFYPALWTRDFCYMVEYAADLIDNDKIRQNLEFIMSGIAPNGWVPDRVYKDGVAKYTAGNDFPALPNLDNGPFLVIATNAYLDKIDIDDAKSLFLKWDNLLCKAILCLPFNNYSLIENEGDTLHSPYGFTDCIMKSGLLSLETLLFWRALKYICKWKKVCGLNYDKFESMVNQIEKSFSETFSSNDGMLFSATKIGRKIDIWASAYAVSIGFPLSDTQKKQIAVWLTQNKQKFVYCGQIRHLPITEYWDKMICEIQRDTYQNGGYWAVASGWVFDAVKDFDAKFAVTLIDDLLKYFETEGIFEWVFNENKNLDSYVASATCIYGIYENYLKLKKNLNINV